MIWAGTAQRQDLSAKSRFEQFQIPGSGPWITRLVRTVGPPAVVLYSAQKMFSASYRIRVRLLQVGNADAWWAVRCLSKIRVVSDYTKCRPTKCEGMTSGVSLRRPPHAGRGQYWEILKDLSMVKDLGSGYVSTWCGCTFATLK
jgi:hypothetical protein